MLSNETIADYMLSDIEAYKENIKEFIGTLGLEVQQVKIWNEQKGVLFIKHL